MHDNNRFDDQLRKRLQQAEMPPPPFVWENIALELARKRRRKMWAFCLAASVAAGGLMAGFWLNQSAEKPVAPEVESTGNKLPIAASSVQNQAAELTGSVDSNKPVPENAAQNSVTSLNENRAPLFSKKGEKTPSKTSAFENHSASVEKSQSVNFSGDKTPSSQVVPGHAADGKSQEVESVLPANPGIEPAFSDSPKTAFQFKKWAEFDLLPAADTRAKLPIRTFRQKKHKPDCPSFADHGTAIFLDIHASPERAVKMLATRDTDKPGYLADRRNSEKQSFAWSAGARVGVLLSGKYTLRAGLHYSQVHETFEYYDPEDLKLIVEINVNTGQRDTTFIYGETYEKAFNRFGMLDLPVTFGTEIGRGRFGLSLHGGAAVNLLFWKRGKIISPENGKPAAFTPGAENGEPAFAKNLGFSLLAGAQGFWQVNKKTRLFVEPHYQHRLKSMTLPGHPVDQKMGQGGISFGMTRLLK